MNWRSIFKAMRFVALVSAWSEKALDDGKVSVTEAAELATGICAILGVNAEIDLGTPQAALEPEKERSLIDTYLGKDQDADPGGDDESEKGDPPTVTKPEE